MSQTAASKAADTFYFPTLLPSITQGGVDTSAYTAATSNSAAKIALTLPSNKAKVYLSVSVRGVDIFMALKLGNAAASVTTTTGVPFYAGTITSGWINPNEVDNIEFITASGTGTVHVWASSSKHEGT